MARKSLLWCAVVVCLFGCSAENGTEAETLGQERSAMEEERGPTSSCTISGEFNTKCRGRGGYSKCDDTTAMCCKTTRDENGNPSTFCSSNPDEVRIAPPVSTVIKAPIGPIIGTVK